VRDGTVLEAVLPLVDGAEEAARGLLGRFQFGPDEIQKPVSTLSGGERSRLRLLALLIGDANFLLLDEPTNHLDMGSVEALADALEDYTGTILLITHDRYLIDCVATRVLEISDQRLLNHLSTERYWEAREARLAQNAAELAADGGGSGTGRGSGGGSTSRSGGNTGHSEVRRGGGSTSRAAPAGAAAVRSKQGAEEARRRRAQLRGAEAAILKLEKRLGAIDSELAEPDTYGDDRSTLNRLLDERRAVEEKLTREYEIWERLVDENS